MKLIEITPWGRLIHGSNVVVVDDPDFGQRLWLLAMDHNDQFFPYGPDWMNLAWQDKKFWPIGMQRIEFIGKAPGAIVVIDLFDRKSEVFSDIEFEGFQAERCSIIYTPGDKVRIGELWACDPGGYIKAGTFKFSLSSSSFPTITPLPWPKQ